MIEVLEQSIQGTGASVSFSKSSVEADRIRHSKTCESSLRSERARQAKSVEAASKIYINL